MQLEQNVQAPNPIIKEIYNKFSDEISYLEEKNNLPPRSLFIQLGLHIYKYSREELFLCTKFDINKIKQYSINSNLIYNELFFLINYLKDDLPYFSEYNSKCNIITGKSKLVLSTNYYQEINENGMNRRIDFNKVPSNIGSIIQEKIHYIKSRRYDTCFEYGLFVQGSQIPFAYAAFSRLDRHYLLKLPLFENIAKDNIFVLTRAYSFPNTPYNAMSVLYANCFDSLKQEGAEYIVTALNQNLLFNGSSLRGAGMLLFATSPMKYYYLDGKYSTRRKIELLNREFEKQKFQSTPILWFGKDLTQNRKKRSVTLTKVSEEMYDSF